MSDAERIRFLIQKHKLSYTWLINQIREREGVITDKTEMSAVLSQTRTGKKAQSVIESSIKVLEDYEKLYASSTDG